MPGPTEIRFSGIVPDGVAHIVRTDATGTHTANVKNNLYRLTLPAGGPPGTGTIVWQNADGKAVKTIVGP